MKTRAQHSLYEGATIFFRAVYFDLKSPVRASLGQEDEGAVVL